MIRSIRSSCSKPNPDLFGIVSALNPSPTSPIVPVDPSVLVKTVVDTSRFFPRPTTIDEGLDETEIEAIPTSASDSSSPSSVNPLPLRSTQTPSAAKRLSR